MSIVKTDPGKIQSIVDRMAFDSQFIQGSWPRKHVARFHHSEVEKGDYQRQEYLTETHELAAVYPLEEYLASTEEQEEARAQFVDAAMYTGCYDYAIKQVNTGLQAQHEVHTATASLILEGKYMSRLNHPNIIKFHGMLSSGKPHERKCYDDLGIIVDRISETLEQRIQRWNAQQDNPALIEREHVIRSKTIYMLQIAEAISYLHSRRLLVRNICPQTIGFDEKDTVKIINLENIVELPDEDSDYLQAGLKADVYDWALTFFEMLIQRPVVSADYTSNLDPEAVMEDGHGPDLSDCGFIPYNVQDLLENAWATNTKDRLDIDEVVQRLVWILYGYEAAKEDATATFTESERDAGEISFTDDSGDLQLGLDLESESDDDIRVEGSFLPPPLQVEYNVVEPLDISDYSFRVHSRLTKLDCSSSPHVNLFSSLDHSGRSSGHVVYEMARCA